MIMTSPYDIVILGLSITSSWGNGHATTYRGLVKELTVRGHNVLFLERDMGGMQITVIWRNLLLVKQNSTDRLMI